MYERFSERARRVLVLARQHAFRLSHDRLDSAHLLLGLLEESKGKDGLADRLLGLDLDRALPAVERACSAGVVGLSSTPAAAAGAAGEGEPDSLPLTHSARSLLARAAAEAEAARSEDVDIEHLVLALAQDEESVAAHVVIQSGRSLAQVRRDVRDLLAPRGPERGSSAEDPATRTPALDAFCHDLVERARQGRLDPFVARTAELERLYEILLRHRDANALVSGTSGAGKTALVRGLAIAIAEGGAPAPLLRSRVFALNSLTLLSGTRYRGQLEERVKAVLFEARKLGSAILFVDDVEALLGEEGASTATLPQETGGAGFLSMLKYAFDQGEVRFIVAVDASQLHRFRVAQPSAQRHFQRLAIEPASEAESLEMLAALKPQFERYHDLRIDESALKESLAVSDSDAARSLPGRAVDRLDRACADVAMQSSEPSADLREIDADVARLEREEIEHVRLREFIKAAAGREALDGLKRRRAEILAGRRGLRVVDAAAIRAACVAV